MAKLRDIRRTTLWVAAGGAALTLGGALWLVQPGHDATPAAARDAAAVPGFFGSGDEARTERRGAFLARNLGSGAAALPDDIDVQKLDAAQWQARGRNPVLNPDLVRIFEQILGRAPADPARLLAARIPAEHLAQAQRMLEQYQRYRDELANLTPSAGLGDSQAAVLASVLAARQALQEKYFSGEEIAGLFGDDNRYDAYTVQRLRTAERSDLTLAEKESIVATLADGMLSAEQREARQTASLPTRIVAHNATLEQAGASADERLAARTSEFGAAAATRMAEVDRQQAEWQQRIARLASADPATQQQMRETQFSPTERLRLDAALSLYRARQGKTPQS